MTVYNLMDDMIEKQPADKSEKDQRVISSLICGESSRKTGTNSYVVQGVTLLISIIGTVVGLFIGLLIGVYRTAPKATNKFLVWSSKSIWLVA